MQLYFRTNCVRYFIGWDFAELLYAKGMAIGFLMVARADLITPISITADTNYLKERIDSIT